jgi:hypothetical protein
MRALRLMALALGFATSFAGAAQACLCRGGETGICKEDEFCELGPGMCNTFGGIGVCVKPSKQCQDVFLPVCGCNKETYSNDCYRRGARVQLDHSGPCN